MLSFRKLPIRMSGNKEKAHSRRAVLATVAASAMSIGTLSKATGSPALPPSKTAIQFFPSVSALMAEPKLKAGVLASTLGYYAHGDGGSGVYEISAEQKSPFSISLTNGLFASLLHDGHVNYKMFGAKSDGQFDDGIAIKKAHQYANANRIPVINHSGEFWLGETKLIPIQTNTNWGNSIFHIDESVNSPRETHFEVLADTPSFEIPLTAEQKSAIVAKLAPGTQLISELAPYRNCLIVVKDENDRIGRRYGADYNPRGWAREDFFYVEEHGKLVGDITWTFRDFTHLTAYPCGEGYLSLEGGTFLLTGDNPGPLGGSYHYAGITTRRSRTIIRNQWVGLEKDKQDISLTPRAGFYNFTHVYDILLENIRLIPWEKDREGTSRDLKAGTYGIGGSRVLCGTFRNITAEGSPNHWGVFGTNLYKNFRIENCRLNRVDVHFHGWNISIKDSEIGQRGLTLTGGGKLLIENTTVFNNIFLNFRADYGAKWDGPIRVINCSLKPQSQANATLISMVPGKFDYKYPVVFGNEIIVSDFVFAGRSDWENARYQLLRFPNFSSSDEGGRIVFPQRIALSGISVKGRKKGLFLFDLPDVSAFHLPNRAAGIKNGVLTTNSTWLFEGIQLEDDPSTPNFRLNLSSPYADAFALYPAITFSGCQNLNAEINDASVVVRINDTIVRQFSAGKNKNFEGRILFENCQLQGSAHTGGAPLFRIQAKNGISFHQCEINLPVDQHGKVYPEEIERMDLLKINQLVRHNHSGTRLGTDLLDYLSGKRMTLKREFIAMLKSRHELEDENI